MTEFENRIGIVENRAAELVSDDKSERIEKSDEDGEGQHLVKEGNDLAEAKIVGKRRGEEDSSHGDSNSCCVKRAKNVELLEGDGLDDGANTLVKNIDIQNRQGEEKIGGGDDAQDVRSTDQMLTHHWKRPQSAWMIFLADKRPEIKASRPNCSVAEVVKVCSVMWSEISDEDRAVYDARALEEKQRLQNELKAVGLSKIPPKTGGKGEGDVDLPPDKTTTILLPISRVRNAVRLNEEVKSVNKNALNLVAKATELFVAFLAKATLVSAQQKIDIASLVNPKGYLWWLQGEFAQDDKKRAGNGKGGGNIFKASSNGTAVSKLARKKGMKAITDFFDQWSSSAGHGEGQRIEQSSNSIEENNDDDL